jgi:hypothetical protein
MIELIEMLVPNTSRGGRNWTKLDEIGRKEMVSQSSQVFQRLDVISTIRLPYHGR